jgi:hypothetical protein
MSEVVVEPGGRRDRLLRRAGSVLLVLAVLGAGHALITSTPDTERSQRPFIRSAAIGTAVDARAFTATVIGLRGAASIKQSGATHDTQGVWVIVRIMLVARTKPVSISYAALRDGSGRTYLATDRINQPLVEGGRILQPGVAVDGEVAFEIPRNSAGELSVRLTDSALEHRLDAMAEVTLPIADVSVWLADPTPATLAAPQVAS